MLSLDSKHFWWYGSNTKIRVVKRMPLEFDMERWISVVRVRVDFFSFFHITKDTHNENGTTEKKKEKRQQQQQHTTTYNSPFPEYTVSLNGPTF